MKSIKCLYAASLLAIGSTAAMAQASYTDKDGNEYQFKRHWFLDIQAGGQYTVGEASFSDLLSPNFQGAIGYQFSPVFGARLNVNGWQAKGAVNGPTTVYKFNYIEGAADLMVDVASIFAGYKFDRTLNPYIFGGVGVNYAFNNDEANDAKIVGKFVDGYLWDGSKVSPAFRAGAGLNIRLTDVIALNLEGNCSFLDDHFNSKKGSKADFQIKAVAGLTFSFGKAKPVPAPVPVPAPAPVVKPEPEPEPVVEEKVEVVPAFESLSRNILFVINKWDIRESEQLKIDEVVEALKANPDTKVRVSGYADKATGTAKRNKFLSEDRKSVV